MKDRLKTRLWEHKMAIAVLTAVLLLAVPVAPASASPLTISLVAAGNITDTSATITWVTDEPATSLVNYGNTTALGSTASDGTLVTDHAIGLTNLSPATLYYYEVSSTNAEGNTTVDSNDGAYYTFTTAAPGTTPLTISSVAAGNITDTSATITWITNEPATSLVNYGNTTALGSTVSDSALITDHAIGLTNLTPATLYYYEVSSTDAEGNTTVDSNGGAYYTFTTAAPGTTPLTISSVAAGNITDTSAIITWITNEPATSLVNYGNTTALGSTVSDSALITDHAIGLTNLTPATLYYYEVSSTDAEGNTTVNNNNGAYYTFTTAAPGTTPLTISSVAAGNTTDTSAIITWITNEPATSLVNYGNTTTLGSIVSDSALVTDHAIGLTNLTPAMLYYYEVSSTDAEGNTTVNNNNGAYYTFTTGMPPPTISGVWAGNITDTSAIITWTTDQLGNSTVNYGATTALGSTVSDSAFTFNHAINLTGLTPDALYYYEVSSTNADGNTAIDNNNGAYYTFTTAKHLELQGWGWCTNYGKIADATLAGYVFVVERANAPESYSMHAVGNLTLQLSDTSIETVALDMYGSRVRSLFYLRQEETGKSASLKGTWIDADAGKYYIGTEGMIALPNPEGEAFKTARLCFVLLRTPEVDVPVKEPGSFVEDLEYLQTTFVKFFDGLIDRLMLTDFADILGRVLAKIMVMLAAVRELGVPYIP